MWLLRGGASSEPPSNAALQASLMERIAAKHDDKDAAFQLRQLALSDRSILPALATSLPNLLVQSFSSLDDEVLQVLLEVLVDAFAASSAQTTPSVDFLAILLTLAQSAPSHWVRLVALACLDALAASASSLEGFIDQVLKVPSSLEMLLRSVEDHDKEVASVALGLLQRLSHNDQVKQFVTFADGFQTLVGMAHDDAESTAATDALSVVFNTVKGNPPGQKQFCDSPMCLAWMVVLMDAAGKPALCSIVLDTLRQLARGSVPSPLDPPAPLEHVNTAYQQTRLGATPGLVQRVHALALEDGDLCALATRVLADIVAGHRANAQMVLELGVSSFVSRCTAPHTRPTVAQASAFLWTCLLETERVGLVGHSVAPPPDAGDDVVGALAAQVVASSRAL